MSNQSMIWLICFPLVTNQAINPCAWDFPHYTSKTECIDGEKEAWRRLHLDDPFTRGLIECKPVIPTS
jgi:hypothetical protein